MTPLTGDSKTLLLFLLLLPLVPGRSRYPPGEPEGGQGGVPRGRQQPLLTPCPSVLPRRDELQLRAAYSKSNGQPKSLGAAPGTGQAPLGSPTRGGVKKVSGVGGTTYEISV